MEERDNRNIMCSVLFLDIAEYSKKSVAGQISLKDRFNSYLSTAIRDVPVADRIILDTGDGAAINFLGDVEDALKAALSMRESMLNEDPHLDPPLLVRMGINLGPVRLVRDINGQPNIVGDGINVAQRVMAFADASQILVSRSYYDAVSRLSPQYAGMFHSQGSRTDKHVREHEIYAIGYPGDKTAKLAPENQTSEHHADVPWSAKFGAAAGELVDRFKQAGPRQRALYVGAVAIPVVLIGMLVLKLAHNGKTPALQNVDQVQAASGAQPASAVAPMVAAAPHAESKAAGAGSTAARPDAKKAAEGKPDTKKSAEGKTNGKKVDGQAKPLAAAQPKAKAAEPARKDAVPAVPAGADKSAGRSADAYVSLICKNGAQLYVDGALKGKVTERRLTVEAPPGKHAVIVSSASGLLHKQDVDLMPGRTVQIKPDFCD